MVFSAIMRPWLAAAVLVFFASGASAVEVRVEPAEPRPGDVLRVEVLGIDNPSRAGCIFSSRTFTFHPLGAGRMRTLIGLTARTKPGTVPLTVTNRRFLLPDEVKTVDIVIGERRFTHQRIRMTPKRTRLMSAPESKAALKSIRKTLRTLSPRQEWRDEFSLPSEGRLTSLYGHTRTVNRGLVWSWHKGVDIAARRGTPILAPNAGRVALTARYPVQGRILILDHGQGMMSAFMHLNRFHVQAGDAVERGTLVGDVGNTGFSTGPHLHWAVYVHGAPVDPLRLLDRRF